VARTVTLRVMRSLRVFIFNFSFAALLRAALASISITPTFPKSLRITEANC
jgi:hypothetical protein